MALSRLLLLILSTRPVWQDRQYVLSVDVELVNVTATVIDASAGYLEELRPEDFQVLENGREQKISFFSHEKEVPISLGVLIDTSGSLQDKLREGLQAVNQIATTLSPNDEMFIMTFNSRAEIRQKFTSNTDEILRSLQNLRASGETAVYDAISLGVGEMKTAKHRKKILLLLSDCFDTKSKIKGDQIEQVLKRSDILLYAIGIDDGDIQTRTGKRPRYRIYDYMLDKLTSAGGGRLIRLYTGQDHELRRLAETLLGELHQEYTMSYYPAKGPESPESRSIEVRDVRPDVRNLGEKLHFDWRE